MMRIVLVFLIIVPYAFPCERFTFEEGFDELFSTDLGFCSFIDGTWVIGTFESMNMEGFHERSAQYIYPNEQTSCISSPTFVMDPGGIIEVNIFMANQMDNDLIQVMILEEYSEVGTASQWGHDFAGGWGTIQITIVKNSQFRGIISIISSISSTSIVLVDSLRYLPPGISKTDCLLYEMENEDTIVDNIYDITDDNIDDMTEKTTQNITDVTSYATTNGDGSKSTDGISFTVTGDATDGTTDNITNAGTRISHFIHCMSVCISMMYLMGT